MRHRTKTWRPPSRSRARSGSFRRRALRPLAGRGFLFAEPYKLSRNFTAGDPKFRGIPRLRSEIGEERPNQKLGLFLAHTGVMPFSRTLTEKLATTMLARDGIAILWRLHIDAARAYRTGHPEAAVAILEIADAAEEAWLRTKGARIFS